MIRKVTPYTFYTQRESLPHHLSTLPHTHPLTHDRAEYGLVLRMQSGFLINPDWPDSKTSARGEWRSMGVSNWLLSASRIRPPSTPHLDSHTDLAP